MAVSLGPASVAGRELVRAKRAPRVPQAVNGAEAPRELLADVSKHLKLLLAEDADMPCVVCQRQCAVVFKQNFDGKLWHQWFQQETSVKARVMARMTGSARRHRRYIPPSQDIFPLGDLPVLGTL